MIITLLSDLGTKDATVAVTKAALRRLVPGAVIVDISHLVARDNWHEAAYLLRAAYGSFPRGTVHICIVAPFGERVPRMVLAEKAGHYFISPDNGLLPEALGPEEISKSWASLPYTKPFSLSDWINDAGTHIQTLNEKTEDFFLAKPEPPIATYPPLPAPQVTPINTVCRILYADRYCNLVLNITKREFENIVAAKPFRIKTFKGQTITKLSNHYNDEPAGTALCRFNRQGYLEVAVNHGSAMELFGFDPDNTELEYQTVRIFM